MSRKRYHFDLGNSNKGPIGFCAAVYAHSKQEAVDLLHAALPEDGNGHEIPIWGELTSSVDYVEVYFNTQAITVKNIDEVTEEDGDDDEKPE